MASSASEAKDSRTRSSGTRQSSRSTSTSSLQRNRRRVSCVARDAGCRDRSGSCQSWRSGFRPFRRIPPARWRHCANGGIRIPATRHPGCLRSHRTLRRRTARAHTHRLPGLLSHRCGLGASTAGRCGPARTGHRHRREVGRVRRRQDADRAHTFFGDATAALPRTAYSRHRHAAEIEQELGMPVTFVPHLVPLDRGIFETIYAQAAARHHDATSRSADTCVRGSAVRQAHRQLTCPRSSMSRTRISATSAGAFEDAAARDGGLHRQSGEGSGRTGDSELQRGVRVRPETDRN